MNEGEVTSEELRELIRLGHGMIKDIRQVQREARATIVELEAKIEEFRAVPQIVIREALQPTIDLAMKQIAEDVADTTREATDFVEKTIYDRFDVLMGIILGDGGVGDRTIPELLLNKTRPKIDLSKFTDQQILDLNKSIRSKS